MEAIETAEKPSKAKKNKHKSKHKKQKKRRKHSSSDSDSSSQEGNRHKVTQAIYLMHCNCNHQQKVQLCPHHQISCRLLTGAPNACNIIVVAHELGLTMHCSCILQAKKQRSADERSSDATDVSSDRYRYHFAPCVAMVSV